MVEKATMKPERESATGGKRAPAQPEMNHRENCRGRKEGGGSGGGGRSVNKRGRGQERHS